MIFEDNAIDAKEQRWGYGLKCLFFGPFNVNLHESNPV